MAAKQVLRRLGYLVGSSVALLPLLLQPVPTAAASSGTLFGIIGSNQSILASIDPTAGTETQLADLSVPGADAQTANLTSDPTTHRLFMIRTSVTFVPPGFITITEQLLTVSSQTGAILASPTLVTQGLQNLAFDPSTSTLFGFTGSSVVRVDPTTGSQTLVAAVANPTFAVVSMAIAPGQHAIYLSLDTVGPGTSTQIVTVDTMTGATSTSPTLTRSVRSIAYDALLGSMFGVTDCCPFDFVQIDPVSGTVTPIANIGGSDSIQPYWTATDPGSHTTFLDVSRFDPITFTQQDQMASINEQSGAVTLSPLLAQGAGSLAFETLVVITPESIKADVRNALASGAIDNHGVANSLLAKLNAASDARSSGKCSAAASIYNAFIHELNAQSGKHIAKATADLLISEAQFLIANCP